MNLRILAAIFFIVLVIAGLPIIFGPKMELMKDVYASEYIKTIVTICTIVFSLLLTLILESYREKKNTIESLIKQIEDQQLFFCDKVMKNLEKLVKNKTLEEEELIEFGSMWFRLKDTQATIYLAETYINNTESLSRLIFQNTEKIESCNEIIKEMIDENNFTEAEKNADFDTLSEFLLNRKIYLNDLSKELKSISIKK